jgi:nickel transport protein
MADRYPLIFLVWACLAILFLPAESQAHRVLVFAYLDQGEIVVKASFSRNRPVAHGRVTATLADGTPIFQGKTDAKGELRFPRPDIPAGERLVITVNGGPGHQGRWVMTPEDLGFAIRDSMSAPGPQPRPGPPLIKEEGQQVETIETIVNRAVAREVAPLKAMMARHMETGPSWRNIIGGIGWIVGLAGLWSALSRRKKERKNEP